MPSPSSFPRDLDLLPLAPRGTLVADQVERDVENGPSAVAPVVEADSSESRYGNS